MPAPAASVPSETALLFRGCVMDGLFPHVHAATIRTLTVNGYSVHEVPGQVCCGALHAHAGLHAAAQARARVNQTAFGGGDTPIVVNSAGCGAMLKQGRPEFAARVRDVTELLAARGPAPGAPLALRVAYDAPCHLLHASGSPPRRRRVARGAGDRAAKPPTPPSVAAVRVSTPCSSRSCRARCSHRSWRCSSKRRPTWLRPATRAA
jgi:glycolate oxidase iron-sulfur subunit